MQRAKHKNIHIGRPKGETESQAQFLAKPKNKEIATVLKKGLSLRKIAKETGTSVNTVRKVKAAELAKTRLLKAIYISCFSLIVSFCTVATQTPVRKITTLHSFYLIEDKLFHPSLHFYAQMTYFRPYDKPQH